MAAFVVVADQVTKSFVRVAWDSIAEIHPLDRLVAAFMEPMFAAGESLPVLGEAFRISHVRNLGAAFGLLPGYRPLFIATSIIVLIVVAGFWRKAHPDRWPVVIGLALVSGGAVGNLIDRILIGKVTDFFDLAVVDFPVFNIADAAIVTGVGLLIVWLLFGPQPGEPSAAFELAEADESADGRSERLP